MAAAAVPTIEGIDHVHLEVRDRDAAAAWYARVLGLRPHEALAAWASDPMGPLVLATAGGTPVLSLFMRNSLPPSRDATVAFRMDGRSFLSFRDTASSRDLRSFDGSPLTEPKVVDHRLSWSLYFADPDHNRIEATTYDYEFVRCSL